MTDRELQAYVGKPVRLTLADGRTFAGMLQIDDALGHGHAHYSVVSDPIVEGDGPVVEVLHGAASVTTVEDASDDPAATE